MRRIFALAALALALPLADAAAQSHPLAGKWTLEFVAAMTDVPLRTSGRAVEDMVRRPASATENSSGAEPVFVIAAPMKESSQ